MLLSKHTFILTCFLQSCLSQSNFLFDMVDFFNSKSVVMHTAIMGSKSSLLTAVKSFNDFGLYSKIIDNSKNCSLLLENVDIHFVSYDQTSISHVLDCFTHRKRYNKEVWVLITQSPDIQNVKNELKSAKLDLDDQIFAALPENGKLSLQEIYKVSELEPIRSNDVGTWSSGEGLLFSSVPKWYRRGNLQVSES